MVPPTEASLVADGCRGLTGVRPQPRQVRTTRSPTELPGQGLGMFSVVKTRARPDIKVTSGDKAPVNLSSSHVRWRLPAVGPQTTCPWAENAGPKGGGLGSAVWPTARRLSDLGRSHSAQRGCGAAGLGLPGQLAWMGNRGGGRRVAQPALGVLRRDRGGQWGLPHTRKEHAR